MPFKCCVLGCRGNYSGGPKVSVFAFPKDPSLQKEWLLAINRHNFTPSNNSRVCELHFNNEDIERVTEMHIVDTGDILRVPLKTPRLTKDAVPLKMPDRSDHVDKPEDGSEPKKSRLKHETFEEGVGGNCALASDLLEGEKLQAPFQTPRLTNDSVISKLRGSPDSVVKPEKLIQENSKQTVGNNALTSDLLESFDDFNRKLNTLELSGWLVSRKSEETNFFYEDDSDWRGVKLCVSVNKQLIGNVFYEGQKLNISETAINSLCELKNCLKEALSILETSNPSSVNRKINLIQDLLYSLRNEIPGQKTILDSIIEKVTLLEVKSSC